MKTQSSLSKYFEKGQFGHCILFYGADIQAQYDLTLTLAQKLNPDEISQKWISENKHPAVATVRKEEGKTAISIDQSRAVKNSLASTSDYHRVFIFYDENGLSEKNFTEEAANALLKTFEEPPENTTFFFLTRHKEDMLSTVISRAQSFYVPSVKDEARDWPPEAEFLNVDRGDVLSWCAQVKDVPLDKIQNYTLAALRQNPQRLASAIKDIEVAKQQLDLKMNPQNVLETLAFKLIL